MYTLLDMGIVGLFFLSSENFYHVPFEKFERYVPYGTPDDVANDLAPFVDAGCSIMNLKVVAGNDSRSIAATKIIAQSLRNR